MAVMPREHTLRRCRQPDMTPYQTAGIADAADGGATEGICHAESNFTGLIQTRNCLAICVDYLALIVQYPGRRQ